MGGDNMGKALAAVLTAPRTFDMREFPLPEIGKEDGILRIEANGLCGTDYDQYLGRAKLGPFGQLPIIPGHETIGWIEKIGADAAQQWKVKEGDRVCVKAPLPCGRCRNCRSGASHRCERHMGYGLFLSTTVAPSLWGGFATHLYLHRDALLKPAPAHIPTDVMTLFNPLSGVVRWIYEIPNLRMAEHVVILGPGQRGILAALTAKQAGAKTVTVTGLAQDAHRLALAKKLGADTIVDVSQEDLVKRVYETTGGEMADLVLDMSAGSTEPIVQAVDIARQGGRIVLAGLKHGQAVANLVTDKIVLKELQIMGGFSSTTRSLDVALEILKQRHMDLTELCSHVYPLEEADTAVRALGREIDDGKEVVHVNLNMTKLH
jgi:threonine dehydrogenase-like Zn-dependent dehydrogenase